MTEQKGSTPMTKTESIAMALAKPLERAIEALSDQWGVSGKVERTLIRRAAKALNSGEWDPDSMEGHLIAVSHMALMEKTAAQMKVGSRALEIISSNTLALPAAADGSRHTNPDLIAQLKEDAGNARTESLQELYARVLASEMISPGSVSKITLGTVRELDGEIARGFDQCLSWVIRFGADFAFIPVQSPQRYRPPVEYPTSRVLMRLVDARLVRASNQRVADGKRWTVGALGDLSLRWRGNGGNALYDLASLTSAGNALAEVSLTRPTYSSAVEVFMCLRSSGYLQVEWSEDGGNTWISEPGRLKDSGVTEES